MYPDPYSVTEKQRTEVRHSGAGDTVTLGGATAQVVPVRDVPILIRIVRDDLMDGFDAKRHSELLAAERRPGFPGPDNAAEIARGQETIRKIAALNYVLDCAAMAELI